MIHITCQALFSVKNTTPPPPPLPPPNTLPNREIRKTSLLSAELVQTGKRFSVNKNISVTDFLTNDKGKKDII